MGGSTRLKSAQDGWELGVNIGLVRVFAGPQRLARRLSGLPAEAKPPIGRLDGCPAPQNLEHSLLSEAKNAAH